MIRRRGHNLVIAIHLQKRGFAFVLFEGWLAPLDWGVQDIRAPSKNRRSLQRIKLLLELHTPDELIIEDISSTGGRRASRIRRLNAHIIREAALWGIVIRTYSRSQLQTAFADNFNAITKFRIAETIVEQLPALGLYLPPRRKAWMSKHPQMGLFEAAALAWIYFNRRHG